MSDLGPKIVIRKTIISWDLSGLVCVLVVAFFLLCTSEGNRALCARHLQPTFIDCTKLPPPHVRKSWWEW